MKTTEEFAAEHIGRFVLQIASLQSQIVALSEELQKARAAASPPLAEVPKE